jgi:hypothetical protein
MIRSQGRDAEERQLAADFDVMRADFQAGMASLCAKESPTVARMSRLNENKQAQQEVEEALEQLESH